jgi:integrase
VYLRNEGKCPNTTSFYLRNLRSLFNKARKAKLILQEQDCSFEEVYTGIDKTVKRAVKKEVITKLAELKLLKNKGLRLSQQLFMFSFYTRGMSFIDMAFLKKTDLKDGIIRYRRKKTGQWLEIKATSEIMKIINLYKEETRDSKYLLPILKSGKSQRLTYESALRSHNNHLKRISEMLNLEIPLTSYVARHSWATIAKDKNIPLSVISESLGHDSQQTTQIYLASFDHALLHEANRKVIS